MVIFKLRLLSIILPYSCPTGITKSCSIKDISSCKVSCWCCPSGRLQHITFTKFLVSSFYNKTRNRPLSSRSIRRCNFPVSTILLNPKSVTIIFLHFSFDSRVCCFIMTSTRIRPSLIIFSHSL